MDLLLTSIIAFASTNIDDIFILTLLFGDKRYRIPDIYFGHYLGFILLLIISVAGSLIGNFIDSEYIGLLGLFPLYLGVKQIFQLINNRNEPIEFEIPGKTGILNVAVITFANGGDNIGTYIPLLSPMAANEKIIMIIIFLSMLLIWLLSAKYLTSHPVLTQVLSKYGHLITPFVLCLLGIYILYENGSYNLLKGLLVTNTSILNTH